MQSEDAVHGIASRSDGGPGAEPSTGGGLADGGRSPVPGRAPTGDDGMATAEYAIVTLAAAGFAGLLAVILRSPEVREAITSIIRSALSG